jgi:hypothetical protein
MVVVVIQPDKGKRILQQRRAREDDGMAEAAWLTTLCTTIAPWSG